MMIQSPPFKAFRAWLLVGMAAMAFAAKPVVTATAPNINLGSVVGGPTASGTVKVIGGTNALTFSGGTSATKGSSAPAAVSGAYTFTGTSGKAYTVTATASGSLTGPTGSTAIPCSAAVCYTSAGAVTTGGTIAAGTNGPFYVGVTLTLAANQKPGTYTRTAAVTLTVKQTTPPSTSTAITFNVTVIVEPVITITKTASLDFGLVGTSASPGTVVLLPSGSRNSSGGLSLSPSSTGTPASFSLTGYPSVTYGVTLPASAITLSGPGTGVTVDTFTSSSLTGGGTPRFSAAGADTLTVGATLHVGANPIPGSYSGTYSVIVAYN